MRIGMGFDIHRLEGNRPLMLGGVAVPSAKGLIGHSDADVLLHALTDALLGAVGAGDIGSFFPDTDPQWKGAASRIFVTKAKELVASKGYRISNVDLVLVTETPKISPHRQAILTSVAGILGIDAARLNLKAKTMEKLGPIGQGEAMAAYAVALLEDGAKR